MTNQEKLNRFQDFEVHYRFFTPEKSGREIGLLIKDIVAIGRTTVMIYKKIGIYMIWPEFEDKDGEVIQKKLQVLLSGTARMWIVSPEMIEKVHKKIKIGTTSERFGFIQR